MMEIISEYRVGLLEMVEQNLASAETEFVSNIFGTVTNKRVIYFRSKSWFSGGSREDVPLKHVTSVRVDTSRSIIGGIVLVILGLFTLKILIGILFLAFGILLLIGSPSVVVNTAGGDLSAMRGWPWMRGDAEAFASCLRQQLFIA